MSFLTKLFGRAVPSNRDSGLPPELSAFYERLCRDLDDENAQNDRLPLEVRDVVKNGVACDRVPNGSGQFGKEMTNPIPVNGRMRELIYLSNLFHESGQRLLFHRLGSVNAVDIYELVTFDGRAWDVLYLDFYHPRKSRQAPAGYSLADTGRTFLFHSTNDFVEGFPRDLHLAVSQAFERVTGVGMCPPVIRETIESTKFIRPPEHAKRVAGLLISGRTRTH